MRRRAWVAGVLVMAPALAVGAAVLLFDGEALRARVVAAVGQATGRVLTVAGPVRLAWSLAPTVSMEGVSLANPPGFSRPAMATVDRVEVQFAVWPLLQRRVEIRSLTLAGPDVLLERDTAGRSNWVFSRAGEPAPTGPASQPGTPGSRLQMSVDAIRVRDGRLGWLSGGTLHRLDVPFLGADTSASRVVTMGGTLAADGLQVSVAGTTGPLSTAGEAWPVDLTVLSSAPALSAHIAGTLGANIALTAELEDLSAFSGLAGRPLPPLRGVRAAAQLGPSGLSALTAQAMLDIGPLHLTRLALAAAAPDQPLTISAEGLLAAEGAASLPVTLSGSAGSLMRLLQPGPTPVQARLQADGASLAVDGTVDLQAGTTEAQVSARVPDMQALGAAAGMRLPALRDLALDSRVAAAGPGSLLLRGLRLTWPGADLAGDLALALAPRPSVKGSLVSERLALDGLAAASAPPVPAPAPLPAAPPQPAPARVLSDAPLPFDMLRRADVDVQLAVNEASWRGTMVQAVVMRVLLQGGRLQLGPATAQVPGGAASAQVSVDAGAQTVGIAVQAQDLGAGLLLALLGTPQGGTGTVDLDIDLHSQGATPRAMGAALSGHAGLAVVDGDFDLGGLLAVAGNALRRANLPLEGGGRSRVRCLAVRLDAAAGQVALGTLLLDSARLHLDGEGGVTLADETLDLRVRPQVRLGLSGVSVPLHVSGPVRTPKVEAEIKGGAGRQGLMIGAPAPADECGPRLTAARGGRAGTMPATPAEAPRTKPADLLRSLLR